jgi:predicted ATPase
LEIGDERIENSMADPGKEMPYFYFHFNSGRPMLNVRGDQRYLRHEEVNPQQSVLAQRKDLDQYPELTYLGRFFAEFRLYRDWEFGPESRARDVYAADLPNDFLEEDASNLGLMLNKLQTDPGTRMQLRENVKAFYVEAEDIILKIEGGWVEIRVEEKGGVSIPQVRLSDGTLRWLSLLTILLHPTPPPLVCIEEPELGLHPDMIRPLAKLLVGASERMQLIVTTHSDALVDELTDRPESVIVCEKEGGSSILKRLDKAGLSSWLERYSLGQLWRTGEIGGNRW